MKGIARQKIILLSIRGLSVAAKFFFTLLFFKFSEEIFGAYSLLAVSILLLVYVMGADFYSYANRELLKPGVDKQKVIFNQFLLYFLFYLVFLPLVYVIYKQLNLKLTHFWLFYLVLITEHLGFEFYRLLFIFKKPLSANINLFLRNGFWVLIAAYLLWSKGGISLDEVLVLWLVGNMSGLFFSLLIVLGKKEKWNFHSFRLDYPWIRKGLLISFPYILATIAYKTIEFADRYMIDYFMDKKAVGVYSFFANMANVMNIVLFTLVVSILYPYLVEGIMEKDKEKFDFYFKKFKKEIIVWSMGMLVLLSALLPVLLILIGKSHYLKDFYVFLLLAISNFFLNLSFLYHYVIYAHRLDWTLFKTTLIGALANVLLNLFLIPYLGIGGAALATFVSFLLILLIKRSDALKLI